MSKQIKHEESKSKFFAIIDERESHLIYEKKDGTIDIKHTMVSPEDRGKKIAEELTVAALEYAQRRGLDVIPSCSYVESYIEKHPKWKSLTSKPSAQDRAAKYWPVILLTLFSFLGSVIFCIQHSWTLQNLMHFFMGFFLAGFSFFKLLDLGGFKEAYKQYDLVAGKIPAYGYVYPFLELTLGALYLSFALPTFTYAATFVLMTVSSAGVILAVIKGKDIQCGCMGTMFDLPMSTVTIVEDVTMAMMALVMLLQ